MVDRIVTSYENLLVKVRNKRPRKYDVINDRRSAAERQQVADTKHWCAFGNFKFLGLIHIGAPASKGEGLYFGILLAASPLHDMEKMEQQPTRIVRCNKGAAPLLANNNAFVNKFIDCLAYRP